MGNHGLATGAGTPAALASACLLPDYPQDVVTVDVT